MKVTTNLNIVSNLYILKERGAKNIFSYIVKIVKFFEQHTVYEILMLVVLNKITWKYILLQHDARSAFTKHKFNRILAQLCLFRCVCKFRRKLTKKATARSIIITSLTLHVITFNVETVQRTFILRQV